MCIFLTGYICVSKHLPEKQLEPFIQPVDSNAYSMQGSESFLHQKCDVFSHEGTRSLSRRISSLQPTSLSSHGEGKRHHLVPRQYYLRPPLKAFYASWFCCIVIYLLILKQWLIYLRLTLNTLWNGKYPWTSDVHVMTSAVLELQEGITNLGLV